MNGTTLDLPRTAPSVPATPTGAHHRHGVGGQWDVMGDLQFHFLVRHGLMPQHRMLDIGCGSLRGGVRFMSYLNPGNYYGIDKEPSLIQAGRDIEMPRYHVMDRQPHLALTDCFDLTAFAGVRFDFMLAQSVFTHLDPPTIELCLRQVMPALSPEGVFFATFFEHPRGEIDPGTTHPWRKGELQRSSYPFPMFAQMAELLGIRADYIGAWAHPRDQRMIAFRPGR